MLAGFDFLGKKLGGGGAQVPQAPSLAMALFNPYR